jgi:hypothetical protein
VSRLRLAALPLLVAACSTAAPPPPEIVETAGPCGEAFGAQTCTWSRSQGDSLLEVGATVALASITAAPDSMPMAWPPAYQADLSMPEGSAASGLVNYTFAWEPTGHPPPTFFTPHVDFHFNLIPASERQAIDCSDRTKPTTLPAGYTMRDEPLPPPVAAMIGVDSLIGTCVPNMGMHALVESEYSATEPFSAAMVIGYYGGRPIFLEPMIARARLLERASFTLAIPEIPGLAGPYPRAFRADWMPETETYRFTFSEFRTGS